MASHAATAGSGGLAGRVLRRRCDRRARRSQDDESTRDQSQPVGSLRPQLTDEQHERLISGLATVIGWEAMIVLRDLRCLNPAEETKVTLWAARALINAILAEDENTADQATVRSRTHHH